MLGGFSGFGGLKGFMGNGPLHVDVLPGWFSVLEVSHDLCACIHAPGLALLVWGLGFGVWGLGFRV